MFVIRSIIICLSVLLMPKMQLALNVSVGDVFSSVASVGKGVAQDITNRLPTPTGLFETSKQLVAGYPFEFVSSSINTICSSALSSNTIKPRISVDINKMSFQLRTPCKRYNYPLLKAEEVWNSPAFDPKKKVVILATGWTTTVNETEAIDVISKAYFCRGDVNFVAVDAASFVDTLYTWSAFNTEEIGENIAKGIIKLLDRVPVERIHLIGHSLGAHIVGAAGRYLNDLTGKAIPRITGLDPAKPCFNEGEALSGLARGDADFIDIIHTNPGVLGKREPLGDVDFYPGGLDPLPTGCVAVTCAHGRAWEFYAETVYPGNERNFVGTRCNSLTRAREKKCPGLEQPMGYATPSNIKGSYFLEVNGESPFGKLASASRHATHKNCGICENAPKTEPERISKGFFSSLLS